MIRLDRLKRQPEMRIEKLPVGGAIEVLTCKRNRGITIPKEADGMLLVREHGYHEEVYPPVTLAGPDKPVAKIAKREFPRSTNIRIYTHEPGDVMFIQDQLGIKI